MCTIIIKCKTYCVISLYNVLSGSVPSCLEEYKCNFLVLKIELIHQTSRIHQFNEIYICVPACGITVFFHTTEHFHLQCVSVTWYLSVDMQLYLLSPLLLLPLLKRPKFGLILLEVVTTISVISCFLHLYLDPFQKSE